MNRTLNFLFFVALLLAPLAASSATDAPADATFANRTWQGCVRLGQFETTDQPSGQAEIPRRT